VAYPDQALKGSVQSIATSAKRSSYRQGLSFTVKILLNTAEEDIDVRPGMSCRAEIFTKIKGKTIAVPIESIVFEDADNEPSGVDAEQDSESITIGASNSLSSTSHVFLLVDGKAVKRNVELGISNDRLQEITSGLAVDDKVIVGPARALSKLKEGESVKEIEKKAA
jgi:HlyD family secretion protein